MLVFPEGRKGTEKLYKDRYRLRRFGRGGFVEAAMRARAPIVPIAVVGAEEAAAGLRPGQAAAAADRAALLPDHADLPALRPARGCSATCRPSSSIRFLPAGADRRSASATSRGRTRPWCRPWRTRSAPRIQDELARHARRAAQRLVRMSVEARSCSPGCRRTGAAGWPRRSSSDPAVEAIIGVDRRPPKVELHRTEYVRVTDSHSLIRRIVEAAEIDTVVDTRLVVDSIVTSAAAGPREQRDRAR